MLFRFARRGGFPSGSLWIWILEPHLLRLCGDARLDAPVTVFCYFAAENRLPQPGLSRMPEGLRRSRHALAQGFL